MNAKEKHNLEFFELSIIDKAVYLLKNLNLSTFPLNQNSKIPPNNINKEITHGRPTPDCPTKRPITLKEIPKVFSNSKFNAAINLTHYSKTHSLIAIDFDALNKTPAYSWKPFLKMFPECIDTLTILTPSGNRTAIFSIPKDIHFPSPANIFKGTFYEKEFPKVDIKAEYSYYVAPGSYTVPPKIPADSDSKPKPLAAAGYYSFINEIPPIPIPDSLLNFLLSQIVNKRIKPNEGKRISKEVYDKITGTLNSEPNLLLASTIIRSHGPAIEGEGGDKHTHWLAAKLFDLALSDAKIIQFMEGWNRTCIPPWTYDELVTKIENGKKYRQSEFGSKAPDERTAQAILLLDEALQPEDIIRNGKIYTCYPRFPYTESIKALDYNNYLPPTPEFINKVGMLNTESSGNIKYLLPRIDSNKETLYFNTMCREAFDLYHSTSGLRLYLRPNKDSKTKILKLTKNVTQYCEEMNNPLLMTHGYKFWPEFPDHIIVNEKINSYHAPLHPKFSKETVELYITKPLTLINSYLDDLDNTQVESIVTPAQVAKHCPAIPKNMYKSVAAFLQVKLFLKQIICRNSHLHYLNWMSRYSNKAKNPHSRSQLFYILFSAEQGTGKSFIVDVYNRATFNPSHSLKFNTTVNYLEKFNGAQITALNINFEEIEFEDKVFNKLKSEITTGEIQAEVKYKEAEVVLNYANYICTTNTLNGATRYLGEEDRRNVLFHVHDKYTRDQNYFISMLQGLEENDGFGYTLLYNDLLAYKSPNAQFHNKPIHCDRMVSEAIASSEQQNVNKQLYTSKMKNILAMSQLIDVWIHEAIESKMINPRGVAMGEDPILWIISEFNLIKEEKLEQEWSRYGISEFDTGIITMKQIKKYYNVHQFFGNKPERDYENSKAHIYNLPWIPSQIPIKSDPFDERFMKEFQITSLAGAVRRKQWKLPNLYGAARVYVYAKESNSVRLRNPDKREAPVNIHELIDEEFNIDIEDCLLMEGVIMSKVKQLRKLEHYYKRKRQLIL